MAEILSLRILIVSSFSLISASREVILVFAIIISFFRYSICTDSGDAWAVLDFLLAGCLFLLLEVGTREHAIPASTFLVVESPEKGMKLGVVVRVEQTGRSCRQVVKEGVLKDKLACE